MNSPQTIVLHNLYSLYDNVGVNVEGVRNFSGEAFRMINGNSSAWPNLIYAFNSNKLNESVLDDLNDKISEYSFEPVLISEHNPEDLDILKRNGFILVDRWTGMSLSAINYRGGIVNDETDLECCVIGNEELPIWVDIVSTELFGSKPLSFSIFSYLMSVGNTLIALKKRGKIIGSCMLFYDDNDIVGLYMVCIEKKERGKGYGKYLINNVMKIVVDSGKDKTILQSTRIGLPLYQSLGFVTQNILNLFKKEKK